MSNVEALPKEEDQTEDETPGEGHNSGNNDEFIINCVKELITIDVGRQKYNRQAAEIRQAITDRGIDKEAFKDVYSYHKKQRHERDGYDESHKLCFDALNAANTGELFAVLYMAE